MGQGQAWPPSKRGSLKGLFDLQPQRQSEEGPVPAEFPMATESAAGSGAALPS